MAIKSKEELIQSLNDRFTDDTSDEVLSLLEDFSDTLNDYETRLGDSTDWKQKYEDNDKEWREKYKSRFTQGNDDGNKDKDKDKDKDNNEEEDKAKQYTYDSLFKTE